MPRPKTVSDDDVLNAAIEVLARVGADFTLTEVARAIGLSRPTLIQRFGDKEGLLRSMAEQEVKATAAWLETLPVETGPEGLDQFLSTIVLGMGSGSGFSARVAIAAFEARDPMLRCLSAQRYALVIDAISDRLPPGPDRAELAVHLHSVIAGATMHWVASPQTEDLGEFVLARVRWITGRLLETP